MPNLREPYLAGASYLLEFAAPVMRVRFEQARAEAAFGSIVHVQSEQTNVPDSEDPMAPRIVFPSEKKSIAISQLRCQMDFKFSSGQKVEAALGVVEKNLATFHAAATKDFAVAPYGLNALIINVHVPADDPEKFALAAHVYQNLIKVPAFGEVASAQVALGYRFGDYFVNFGTDVYETRRFELVAPASAVVNIQQKETKLIATGLRIRVDVNNRVASERDDYKVPDSPAPLFELLRKHLNEQFIVFAGVALK